MSDPQSKSEILDVLSSIRRLVSEGRKAEPAAPANPVPSQPDAGAAVQRPSAPLGGRFVLTSAFRVDEAATPDPAPLAEDWIDDAQNDRAELAQPAPAPATSLEATIAELEAAVAEIEADFEPDSAPDAEAVPYDLPAEVMPVVETAPIVEFRGIMAGFDTMPMAEERLDAPITAATPLDGPALPTTDFWRTIPAPVHEAALATPGMPSLFLRPARAGDAASQPVPAGEVAPEGDGASATLVQDDTPDQTDADVAPGADLPDWDQTTTDRGEPAPDDEQGAIGMGRLHLGGRGATRPTIFRPTDESAPDELTDDEPASGDLDPDDLHAGEKPDAGLAEDLGMLERSADPEPDLMADEAADLFDPLAAGDIDIDLLRDMVAELVREELRGKLGEKITRNLRQLVRREIERALDAEGLGQV